jgi:hypothetical protein
VCSQLVSPWEKEWSLVSEIPCPESLGTSSSKQQRLQVALDAKV